MNELPIASPRLNRAASVSMPGLRRPRFRLNLERVQPYLYLLPALALVILWVYRPLVEIFNLSFHQWNLLPTSPKIPVGWANYQQVLGLPEIQRALGNTLLYTVGLLPFSLVIPVVIAIFTYGLRGRVSGAYRAVIFTPVIIAPVVVTVLWRWILHPYSGVVNVGLQNLFGIRPINFLGDPNLMIPAIVFITGWGLIGFCTLIFASALTNISHDYLEAAAIDGATYGQTIRYIMLPLLSPSILFVTLLTVLFSSQWTFTHINVLTATGYRGTVSNIYTVLYDFGFKSFNIGVSSASAVLMFIGFGAVAVLFLWLQNRFSFYDS
jgi:multiple sugar transport system permease protein